MKTRKLTDSDWCSALLTRATRTEWVHAVFSRVTPGFGFKDRVTEDQILWLSVDGLCDVAVNGRTTRLEPGSVMWMPPGVVHSASIPAGAKPMLAYSFRFRLLQRSSELRFQRGAFILNRTSDIQSYAEALYDEMQGLLPATSSQRVKCLIYLIFTSLQHAENLSPAERRVRFTRRDRERLRLFVRRNVAYRLSSADLAKVMRLTPDYFARVFRKTFGVSVRRWLMEERLREAAFRISNSTDQIKAIAAGLGYDDVNLFCRQFRQFQGISPTRYRGMKG